MTSTEGETDAGMGDRIAAVEAAAPLGVKRETIYAYVSRGRPRLLHRPRRS